jgi:hypothetical protein
MNIKKLIPSFLVATALAGLLVACASEKSKAKITEAQARQLAMNAVPNGTIKEAELENEKGRLIWSFDMAIPNSKDIKEVNVDAMTGEVLPVETESPAAQAKEKAEDEKEKK